jgi:hypothetical protein
MRLVLALALLFAGPGFAQTWALPGDKAYVETDGPAGIVRLSDPTTRYGHDVLGGIPRWGTLGFRPAGTAAGARRVVLPETLVFEDTGARFWDVTGDGRPEIIVVESSLTKGGRLAVWSAEGQGLTRLAVTEHIGRPNRWLAPLAVGDFDGDGTPELTYVDRPHLARELVFLRYGKGRLREIARLKGVTNHRIGDAFISGGARNCGKGDEAILVTSDWSQIIAVTLQGNRPRHRSLGTYTSATSLKNALACRL